jgi:hypothetical protein
MLFFPVISSILEALDSRGSPMLWIIAHTEIFFPLLLGGLILIVELGFRLRQVSTNIDAERQSLIESARDELIVLLGLLLGFSLPMALPHYEHRNDLMVDEANAIATVEERAQLLPEPFREKILLSLRGYVDARLDFDRAEPDERVSLASVEHAHQIHKEILQETAALTQQTTNALTSLFVQSLGTMGDMIEQRLAAEEKRIPSVIWMVHISISVLASFVVGYSMRRRLFLTMIVLPLTVAIVLSLVGELDNPRTGFVREGQQSMQRLHLNMAPEPVQ